eukprot:8934778-Ditylum_brightwellii.AAC.1
MSKYKAKACQWIDNLEESLDNLFPHNKINKITTGSKITHSYKLVESEYTKDAAIAYKNFLASQNIVLNTEEEYTESQEDHLENC